MNEKNVKNVKRIARKIVKKIVMMIVMMMFAMVSLKYIEVPNENSKLYRNQSNPHIRLAPIKK